MIKLKNHAELFVAQPFSQCGRQVVDPLAEEMNFAGRGSSSVPSKCNSVLLPEPLWPTIARNSPARTCISTPVKHRNFDRAFAVVFLDSDRGKVRIPRRDSSPCLTSRIALADI